MKKWRRANSAPGRLPLYLAPTHGHCDLIGDVLGLALSWIVVGDDLNRLNFKAASKFRVCPNHTSQYLGHVIRQVKLDCGFRSIHRE
ncbi:hypothetical protein QFZ42_004013 [Variovorax paradoxus]|uniref:hypothetical protein n=1 Tax=Variovorax paradoxus TaxID=34073 RepID=UPI00278CB92E|nr:hypothetical protein [Variovorax paradoxus]MDQ0572179.1 hypothetical protein [Variovorax paradoxus]